MDRVKFGRALGYGARHATKTLIKAAEAASTPNPTVSKAASPPRQATTPPGMQATAGARRIPDVQTVKAAGEQAKRSLVTPVVRFSSVVWLQVTGVFFGLVAFTMGMAAWKARATVHAAANSGSAMKVYAYVAVCALFTYFTVSSFVRAARR
jgi:hypothetical protein